jgi:hypothetical protein
MMRGRPRGEIDKSLGGVDRIVSTASSNGRWPGGLSTPTLGFIHLTLCFGNNPSLNVYNAPPPSFFSL